jgi:hypothetical protein
MPAAPQSTSTAARRCAAAARQRCTSSTRGPLAAERVATYPLDIPVNYAVRQQRSRGATPLSASVATITPGTTELINMDYSAPVSHLPRRPLLP